jgi:hypothetical protein
MDLLDSWDEGGAAGESALLRAARWSECVGLLEEGLKEVLTAQYGELDIQDTRFAILRVASLGQFYLELHEGFEKPTQMRQVLSETLGLVMTDEKLEKDFEEHAAQVEALVELISRTPPLLFRRLLVHGDEKGSRQYVAGAVRREAARLLGRGGKSLFNGGRFLSLDATSPDGQGETTPEVSEASLPVAYMDPGEASVTELVETEAERQLIGLFAKEGEPDESVLAAIKEVYRQGTEEERKFLDRLPYESAAEVLREMGRLLPDGTPHTSLQTNVRQKIRRGIERRLGSSS